MQGSFKVIEEQTVDAERSFFDFLCCSQPVLKTKYYAKKQFVEYEKVLVPQMNLVKIEVENMDQYLKMKIKCEIDADKIK